MDKAGETANMCANYAMRILGAYGYSTEYSVARFYRDAPTYFMVEGSANICKFIVAMDALGIRKATASTSTLGAREVMHPYFKNMPTFGKALTDKKKAKAE